MKSIWEKIKLAFNRKPEGDIKLPQVSGINVTVEVPQKTKKVNKRNTDDNKKV